MMRTLLNIYAAVMLLACNASSSHENDMADKSYLPPKQFTEVMTAHAEEKSFEYFIRANGKIISGRELMITAETGGRLVSWRAQTGVVFGQGSVIAQVDATAARHRLERAQLNHFNSEKEYEGQLLGYENLLKGKTQTEADNIRKKLRISSGLAGAELDIQEAGHELSRAIIKAPFSGMIADVRAQQGELVKPGQELFRIYDPGSLLLDIKVLEADVALLKKDVKAAIIPVSSPSSRYTAVVQDINPYVDESGMVQVKLKVHAQGRTLLFPGMNCAATMVVPQAKALVVPKEAVVMRSGKAVVFTLENGKAVWNYVSPGRENGTEVEILEGLKPNAKVIITNNLQLAHDAPVQESAGR
jgi:membrane fusion protein, multidrug efflux system